MFQTLKTLFEHIPKRLEVRQKTLFSVFRNVVKHGFYDSCRTSRALIGSFLWSICGQTHEFEIHATRQRARAGNSTICYRKNQIDVSF